MARYTILLFAPAPADAREMTQEEQDAHERHAKEVDELGATMLTAFALEPSTMATTIRGDEITDGPFVDAKEVVAGFYVIDAPDLDAALEIARRNPITQQGGGVEVRPVASGFVAGPTEA